MLKQILQGMVVGIANIIPGVSGGTMMVAMGLYDKLIHSITHLKSEFKQSMKLLIPIFAGAGIAIVVLSKLFEFLLDTYPIGKIIPFLVFFAIVILMAMLGETGGKTADVTFGIVNVIKLFFVGVVAAATMVVPGVSGSMMLMLLGYYDVILKTINLFVDSLVKFDMAGLMQGVGVLAPFGVGVLIGIGVIAKLIEFIFSKAEIHAYYGIIGLIVASPIAILMKTNWSGVSVFTIGAGVITFGLGWLIANKLGGE